MTTCLGCEDVVNFLLSINWEEGEVTLCVCGECGRLITMTEVKELISK